LTRRWTFPFLMKEKEGGMTIFFNILIKLKESAEFVNVDLTSGSLYYIFRTVFR
jgi:hypothetical protein